MKTSKKLLSKINLLIVGDQDSVIVIVENILYPPYMNVENNRTNYFLSFYTLS